MNNDLKTTPLVDIMCEMAKLEREINLDILKYNKCVLEVCRRFPFLVDEGFEVFEVKEIKTKKL